MVALGGGAVTSPGIRKALREHALTIHVEVDAGAAWERVRWSNRPLAKEEGSFRALYEERMPLYREVADAAAQDVDDMVLGAAGIRVEIGAIELLGELVPGEGQVALVADAHVAGIYGSSVQPELGRRLSTTHEIGSKTAEELASLWRSLPPRAQRR